MTDHSEDIGFLKAKAENAENQIKNLYEKQDSTHSMVTEIHTILSTHVESSQSNYEEIEEDLVGLKGEIAYCKTGTDNFYQIKKFILWIGAGFAFLWSSIWKVVDKLFFS